MERLRVLYLREPHIAASYLVDAVRERHDLTLFDPARPLEPQFEYADVVVDSGGSVGTRAMVDASPRVRLWQIQGSGIDHFDLGYWRERGVAVANCPGSASAAALAERAMMLTLMVSHRYREAALNLAHGIAYRPMADELGGKTLSLLGFGASAMRFAQLARGFGMRLATVDIRNISDMEAAAAGLSWRAGPDKIDELVAMADVLSVHLHLDAQTRGIIDERRLRLMRSGAIVINVARGELIDEAALGRALSDGWLAGAGLDVFAVEPPDPHEPLLSLPNVVATPHTAGNSLQTIQRRAEFCARNIDRVASGLEAECRVA
jgi:phosphoglycerate dehydrogenase-like enzyme